MEEEGARQAACSEIPGQEREMEICWNTAAYSQWDMLLVGHHVLLLLLSEYKKQLAQLRNYPPMFGAEVADLASELQQGIPPSTAAVNDRSSAYKIFKESEFLDLWEEASMTDVVRYLRGNKSLHIPSEWRELLPLSL